MVGRILNLRILAVRAYVYQRKAGAFSIRLDRYDVLDGVEPGGVFLLNAPYGPDEIWDRLPFEVQESIVENRLRFFVIDA